MRVSNWMKWLFVPVVPFLVLYYFWKKGLCYFGYHDLRGSMGYCGNCMKRVRHIVLGTLYVWEERKL